MWTTQMEEMIVHETNFKESITMLVVNDQSESEEQSDGGESPDEMIKPRSAPRTILSTTNATSNIRKPQT